jgi:uncharacterized protein (DUF1697 family)
MKYLALLRGINVGGNAIIKMAELKKAVETDGFTQVRTYIQSGNIVFESEEKDAAKVAVRLEGLILKYFKVNSLVIVRTYDQLKKVVSEVPPNWNNHDDIRCYIAFTAESVTPKEVVQAVKLKDEVDFIKAGEGVVYMTTLLSGITKSGFTKLISTPVYKYITIRNYTTVQKILSLMEEK